MRRLLRKLLVAFGFLITLIITWNVAWRFYIKPAISRFICWFFTPFRVVSDYTSRSIHALGNGAAGIGHGIAHGASSVAHGLGHGARALGHGAAGIGHGIAHGASSVAHGLGHGARALGHGAVGIGHGIAHEIGNYIPK